MEKFKASLVFSLLTWYNSRRAKEQDMSLKTEFSDTGCTIRDEKNRELMKADFVKCKVTLSRFEETPLPIRELIADVYCNLTEQAEHNRIMEFLNFVSNDENEFCS